MTTAADFFKDAPLDSNGHHTGWDTVTIWTPDTLGYPVVHDRPYECMNCGRPVKVTLNEGQATVDTPCALTDGITTSILLAVPSGRLVVDDDLRPIYDGHSDDFLTYNSKAGQAQVIEATAALGCAYGPVGNTCPSLYRTGEGTYVIATLAWNEDEDSEEEWIVPDGWTELAGICTDLWAYSIADHDDFLAKGGTLDHPMRSVVEVPAGTYRFTHHTGEVGFRDDRDGPTIYVHIELEAAR